MMTLSHADLVTASFEFLGSMFLSLNVYRLYRDKQIRGVSLWPTIFYMGWGIFNWTYYDVVQSPWARIASVMVVIVNAAWLILALKYRKREN